MIKQNEPLANHCTYRIGGPARVLFLAANEREIVAGIEIAKEKNFKMMILGGGSNILFSDRGFDGLVLKLANNFIKIAEEKENRAVVLAGAGAPLAALVKFALDNSLAGMEWAAGIPGTVGGAIRGNAGAFGREIGASVLRVRALEISGKSVVPAIVGKEDCAFGYRESVFKRNKNLVITAAKFVLEKGNANEIADKIKECAEKKRISQPLDFPSAGSVFKNPEGFFAAKIIEDCGLKGRSAGGAQISEKHANFIVNRGNAKADDVLALIAQIKAAAKEKFAVDLKEEIEIV
ncbi:MAG: UDP-N-acetylmuramate dehydrogenase [Candidatus Yanofskyibacterium parasiticum]|nr:MAG: UDP-N-acetylmuramate dehydrogenase [Candidatus Yanofskybacteria bacterium]